MKNEEHGSKLMTAARDMCAVLSRFGDWEDGCFYYNRTTASELEAPFLALLDAIAKTALVAEEQVTGDKSREANETITTLQAKIAGLEGERDAAIREMTGYAREAGEAKGRLEMSEAAGIVDGWRARCEAAEQALAVTRDVLTWVLPMAKGYAHAHPVGNNHGKIAAAEETLNPTPQGGKP